MPPSLVIDNSSIVNYEDLAANTKRASITFTSTETITVSSGNSTSPIRLSNVATPTTQLDAANKQYVDAAILGLTVKVPVRVVATGNGDLATAYAAGSSVDGVTLVVSRGTVAKNKKYLLLRRCG